MGEIELLSAHLRGAHSNERLPGCTACERLPAISKEEPVPALVNTVHRRPPDGMSNCWCGCGAVVRNRFLPGHDAKLKSRLVKEARDGDRAAIQQLEQLGWTKFI